MSSLIFHINKITRSELKIGDHIYSYRDMHIYSHHGIYVGGDRVVHYTRTSEKKLSFSSLLSSRENQTCENCGFDPKRDRGVVKTCLDCFRGGHSLFLFEYDVSSRRFFFDAPGACSTGACDEPRLVLERAEAMLETNGFGEYDLKSNNCECFAFYCKTGKRFSIQIAYLLALGDVAFKRIRLRNFVRPMKLAKTIVEVVVAPKIEALERDRMVHLGPSRD